MQIKRFTTTNALMQVAVNGPPVLESLPVVEIAVKNWLGRKNRRKTKNATASSNLMATVSKPVVTEPITVDAACQTDQALKRRFRK